MVIRIGVGVLAAILAASGARAASPGPLSEIDAALLQLHADSEKLKTCASEKSQRVEDAKKAAAMAAELSTKKARAAQQADIAQKAAAPKTAPAPAKLSTVSPTAGCSAGLRPEGPVIPAGVTFPDGAFHSLAVDYYTCLGFTRGAAACNGGSSMPHPKRPKETAADACRGNLARLNLTKAIVGRGDTQGPCRALLAAEKISPASGADAFCSQLGAGNAAGACSAMGAAVPKDECLASVGALAGDAAACAKPKDPGLESLCRTTAAFRKAGGRASSCSDPLCKALAGDAAACDAIAAQAKAAPCVNAKAGSDAVKRMEAERLKAEEAEKAQRAATEKAPLAKDAQMELMAQTVATARIKEAEGMCDVAAQALRGRIDEMMTRIDGFEPKSPAIEQRRARLVGIQNRFNQVVKTLPPPVPAKGSAPAKGAAPAKPSAREQ